jgi:hypothetical protein
VLTIIANRSGGEEIYTRIVRGPKGTRVMTLGFMLSFPSLLKKVEKIIAG